MTAAEYRNLPNKAKGAPATTRTPAPAHSAPMNPRTPASGQEITFPGKMPGNNGPGGLLRMGWPSRMRLAQRCDWVVAAARLRPIAGPMRLELIRYSIGRQMDYDGLVSTGKYPIDAIVRCGILPDDNPTIIAERAYTQERAASKAEQRTVIRLIPL